MIKEINGLVIKQLEYKENDLILTILSKTDGLISVLAKGVKKMNSKNSYGCALYTNGIYQIEFNEHKSLHLLLTANCVDSNRYIKENLEKTLILAVCTELLESTIKSDLGQNNKGIELYIELIAKLRYSNHDLLSLVLYIANMLQVLGVSPVVDECIMCSSKKISTVSVIEGGFVCQNCANHLSHSQYDIDFLRVFRKINKATFEHYDHFSSEDKISIQHVELELDFLYEYTGIKIKNFELLLSLFKLTN